MTEGDSLKFFGRFMNHLLAVAHKACEINKLKWKSTLESLEVVLAEQRRQEKQYMDDCSTFPLSKLEQSISISENIKILHG